MVAHPRSQRGGDCGHDLGGVSAGAGASAGAAGPRPSGQTHASGAASVGGGAGASAKIGKANVRAVIRTLVQAKTSTAWGEEQLVDLLNRYRNDFQRTRVNYENMATHRRLYKKPTRTSAQDIFEEWLNEWAKELGLARPIGDLIHEIMIHLEGRVRDLELNLRSRS